MLRSIHGSGWMYGKEIQYIDNRVAKKARSWKCFAPWVCPSYISEYLSRMEDCMQKNAVRTLFKGGAIPMLYNGIMSKLSSGQFRHSQNGRSTAYLAVLSTQCPTGQC